MNEKRWKWLGIAGILALNGLIWIIFIPGESIPYEDAAILFRYAENFGRGWGITWNPGMEPVDGATDFLFMILLGLGKMVSIPVEVGARLLNFLAITGMAAMAWRFLLPRTRPIWAVWAVLAILFSPLWLYTIAGFGVPFAAYILLKFWLKIQRTEGTEFSPAATWLSVGFWGFLAILSRPEFVIPVTLFLLITIFRHPRYNRFLPFMGTFGLLAVLGTAWILFRKSYFGFVLPAPFFVKSGIDWSPGVFFQQAGSFFFAQILLPGSIVLGGILLNKSRKFSLEILGVTFIFLVALSFISQETNYFFRYQYAFVPILIVTAAGILENWGRNNSRVSIGIFVFMMVFTGIRATEVFTGIPGIRQQSDGRADVGKVLKTRKIRDFTLLTTEAGLLPWYSGWITIDALGLNDYDIARHGFSLHRHVTEPPEVVMVHQLNADSAEKKEMNREEMARRDILSFVSENPDYIQAGCFCAWEKDCHLYWVRKDFDKSEEIIQEISQMEYYRNWTHSIVKNQCRVD